MQVVALLELTFVAYVLLQLLTLAPHAYNRLVQWGSTPQQERVFSVRKALTVMSQAFSCVKTVATFRLVVPVSWALPPL